MSKKHIKFNLVLIAIISLFISCDWFDLNKSHEIRLSKDFIQVKDSEDINIIEVSTFNIDGKQRNNTNIIWKVPGSINVIKKDKDKLVFKVSESGTFTITAKEITNDNIEKSIIVTYDDTCQKIRLSKKTIKITDITRLNTLTAKTYNKLGRERKNTDIKWKIPEDILVINESNDELIFKVKRPGVFVIKANDKTNSELERATIVSYATTQEQEEENVTLVDLYLDLLGLII